VKAIFLDRDGTVIREPHDEQVDSVDKIQLFPDTIEALKLLASLGYGVVFVTSQPCIAMGLITKEQFHAIHQVVLERLAPSGIKVLKTCMCPHAKNVCDCRKPQPKMLLQAAQEFGVDLATTWMIGDRLSDVMAGVNAGTKTILLQTTDPHAASADATHVASNLLSAVRFVAAAEQM